MTNPFFFDREELVMLADEHRGAYAAAEPFPHAVIDGFLPGAVLDAVLSEFPAPDQISWWAFDNPRERKLGTVEDHVMGTATRQVLAQLNSATMIDFLQALTGIGGLVPDPHFYGGGLHQIERDGFLKVHADFNLHPTTRLERRLNLLLYLNKDWPPAYGGALELWNEEMTAPVQSIEPKFNRCVIFTTSERSYHGHPDPLRCPEGVTRKSMALYYYSAPAHRSGVTDEHNTIFRDRPGELVADVLPEPEPVSAGRAESLRKLGLRWLPPVVADGLRRLRTKSR
jgi:hypothetical protein